MMRVVAMLALLFTHGTAFWLSGFPQLTPIAIFGGLFGIDAFFVLSGFLVARRLFDLSLVTRPGPITAGVTQFWHRRWRRTLPSYFLFLLINFCVYRYVLERPTGGWSYFIFGQNLSAPLDPFFFPESWSLALLQWFYLLAPIAVLVCGQIKRKYALEMAIAACLLGYFLLRLYVVQKFDLAWDEAVRKVVLLRLDAPVYGVAAAYVARFFPTQFFNARKACAAFGVVLLSVAILWCGQKHAVESVLFRALIFSMVPAGFAFTLPYFAGWTRSDSALLTSALTLMSRWSFSIYLIHVLAILLLLKFYGGWIALSAANMAGITLFWLAITFTLSALLYRYFEAPWMR